MVQFKRVHGNVKVRRHEPLHQQIRKDSQLPEPETTKTTELVDLPSDLEDEELLDEKTTQQIFRESHLQRQELIKQGVISNPKINESTTVFDPADIEEIQLSPEDQAILDRFENASIASGSLSKAIIQKLSNNAHERPVESASVVHPKVKDAFQRVGLLLSRYRSGKLPKAFKVIPALKNWQQILAITEPSKWTPHAVLEGVKIFCSNLGAVKAQYFLESVLVPHVHEELKGKRVSVQIYEAMCKSVYRPAAFFKGLVFPMLDSSPSTLKMASVLASVLRCTTIPVLHASAALVQLTATRDTFSGPVAVVLRTMLDKKYALPYKVVDHLVQYFCSFQGEQQELPVLWHQALLVFVQRYKNDLSIEQRANLQQLVRHRGHYQIGPEIARELEGSTGERDAMQTE